MTNMCVPEWKRRAVVPRGLLVALLAAAVVAPNVRGQVFTLTRDQLIQYTAQNPYDRFPDGRPKVPDAVLEKVKGLSAEEAAHVLGVSRNTLKARLWRARQELAARLGLGLDGNLAPAT